MKAVFALALVLSIGFAAAAHAAVQGGNHAGMPSRGPTPSASRVSMGPHSPVTQVKIRTPRQCFRYCRGALGASVDFCAVSCYR